MMKAIYIETIVALCTLGMTACSSDDAAVQTPIAAPVASAVTEMTAADRLAFSWGDVQDAYEYRYALKDSMGSVIAADLTNAKGVVFSDLIPAQTYTFEVTAYPTASTGGTQAGSQTTTLTGRTLPISSTFSQQSDGFAFSYSVSNFSEDVDAVACCLYHNETGTMTYRDSVMAGQENNVSGAVDMVGSYSLYTTGYVHGSTAVAYANSILLKTFSIPSWEISTGSIMLQGFQLDDDGDVKRIKNATLLANADGTYTIKNFYGGSTDFIFKINSTDNSIVPLNAIGNFSTIYNLNHGRYDEEYNPIDIDVLRIDASKSFAYSTDKVTTTSILHRSHGKISLYVYDIIDCDNGYTMPKWGDGCYTFTW